VRVEPDAKACVKARALLVPLLDDSVLTHTSRYEIAASYYWQRLADSARTALNGGVWDAAPDSIAARAQRLLGLIEYETGAFERADSAFALAQSRSDSATRADYDDVRYLLPPHEYAALNALPPSLRAESLAAIWRWRDPDVSTAVNERQVEYRARLAYSDLNFTPFSRKVAGRNTRRGELYTRYGPPTWRQHQTGDPQDMRLQAPTEVWAYENWEQPCTLAVVDKMLSGNYDFPFTRQEVIMDTGERVSAGAPDEYREQLAENPAEAAPEPEEQLHPQIRWARRRAPDGRSRLELFYALPHPDLKFERYHDRSRAVSVATAVLLGASAREAARVAETTQFIVSPTLTTNPNLSAIGALNVDAAPGDYRLALHVQSGERSGSLDGTLRLPDYSDTLAISDLVLASDVGEPLGSKRLGELPYLPSFDSRFARSDRLYVRYEIYNLALRVDERNDYEETTILQPLSVEHTLWTRLAGVIGVGRDTTSVSTSRQIRDAETNPVREYQLELQNYPPGRYRYTIEINDLKAKRNVSTSVEFELTE
jgi:GWxTD domain-containing protein